MKSPRITMKELKEQVNGWNERFEKTGIPDCMICGTPMKMGYDSIQKKKSKYIWEFQCKCHPKDLRLGLL